MKTHRWVPYPRYIFRKEIVLSLIKKHVPKGARFLDIGCASGDFAITLSQHGYEGKMIDFSQEAAEEVRGNLAKRGVTNVEFHIQDFMELSEEHKFGLITMFEVLEHIENDKEAIAKVARLLSSNGIFLFSVPARRDRWGPHDVVAGHFRRYDKAELAESVEEAGFRVVCLLSYGFPWINVAKYVRDRLAARALPRLHTADKTALSQASGLNIEALRAPVFECFFKRCFLFPLIKISCLFHRMDLGDGYVCLARKAPEHPTGE